MKVKGYDAASAFDWYVIQVAVLQQLGVAVAHSGPMPLSRPVVVPGVTV